MDDSKSSPGSFWLRIQRLAASMWSAIVSLFVRPISELHIRHVDLSYNPLKGKPRNPVLSDQQERKVSRAVSEFVTYDAERTQSVTNFDPIKQNTQCIFARKARVWGSPSWDYQLSLEENIFRLLPTLLKFTIVCEPLGLDMFMIELPGEEYGSDVQTFGEALRRVLKVISDHDPAGRRCMDKSYIDKRGWVFEFNKITFFVTTFAPFYPSTNSRYGFECDNCYISLQPEISFAQHDLPPDTPHTEWECPVTVRDRIRVEFKKAGRGYFIRDTIYYPMVEDMVKPVNEGDQLVEWWKKQSSDDKKSN